MKLFYYLWAFISVIMLELPQNLDLENPEFRECWNVLKNTERSVFLTGRAGTGKSTFLRYICENLGKQYVVLAPTGVAAVNVGGMTLHSFFQIPLRPVPPDDIEYSLHRMGRALRLTKSKRKLIRELELIIIDEVSMVRPDIIDYVDRFCRYVRKNYREPFGGVQLLLVGDVFQLEPVVTSDARQILSRFYSNFYFFDAEVFRKVPLVTIELKKVYRQTDMEFVDMLDRFRVNKVTERDLQLINSRVSGERVMKEDDFAVTLTSRRDTADSINAYRLASLPGESFYYAGEVTGTFPDSLLPTDKELELKQGAQVMLIKNDKERRWINGTIAIIKDITEHKIKIELESGESYPLEKSQWENIRYYYDEKEGVVKEEVLGTFVQYPLRPAWAFTIHKSQGLTFNRVIIDMDGGAFSPGQTYVALSRCRSLEGIEIGSLIGVRDVIVSENAVNFSRNFNDRRIIREAIDGSIADRLMMESRKRYDKGDMIGAMESFYDALCHRNDLNTPSVRRLLSMKIGRLQRENISLRQKLMTLASPLFDKFYDDIRKGRGKKARKRIEELSTCCDNSDEMNVAIGWLLVESGEYDKAKKIFSRYQRQSSSLGLRALEGAARMNLRTGEAGLAKRRYNKLLKKFPDRDDIREVLKTLD